MGLYGRPLFLNCNQVRLFLGWKFSLQYAPAARRRTVLFDCHPYVRLREKWGLDKFLAVRYANPRQGWIKFQNACPGLTGIKAVNDNFEGKIKLFLSRFSIFSPFFTKFCQSEGKINCFSAKTMHFFKLTDGNKNSKNGTIYSPVGCWSYSCRWCLLRSCFAWI